MLNCHAGPWTNNPSHTVIVLNTETNAPKHYCTTSMHTNTNGHIPGARALTSLSFKIRHSNGKRSQSGLPWQRASLLPIRSGLPVVISTVCQWKLITRLNALHPWANYQLSGSRYIDHDNPPQGKKSERGRWVHFQGVLKFLTTIH